MGWTEVQDGIQAAVVAACGLAANRVIWGYQNANSPALDYVSLSLSGLIPVGQDGVLTTTDLGRPAGQEIKMENAGLREFTLTIQVFTTAVAGSLDALGRADQIGGALIFPAVRDLMTAVGVSPFDVGAAGYVPDVPNIAFRGRAVLPVRCYVTPQVAAAYTGYIAEITGTTTIDGSLSTPIEEPLSAP